MGYLLALLLCIWTAMAWGDTATHSVPNEARQRQVWQGDLVGGGYVLAGCLPAVPSSSLTLGAVACEGYVYETTTRELLYVAQAAASVGPLSSSSGTYWMALHRDTTTVVSGWTRQGQTHYLWQALTTEPTVPPGAVLLTKVTVAGSVITAVKDYRRPASLARRGVIDFTDALYGTASVGASGTVNAAALQAAATAVGEQGGGTLWIPRGVFAVDRPTFVTASNLIIEGPGTLQATSAFVGNNGTNRALLTLGELAPGSTVVPITNVLIRQVTLDGQLYGTPLYIANCTGCVVSGIGAAHSDTGVIRTFNSASITVEHSRVSGGRGVYGDGVYCGGVGECRVLGNTITDYTRIGIVSEQATTKSGLLLADGNTVSHAHDASGGQANAGIWSENTFRTIITHNVITDQWNNPPDVFSSIGIKLSDLQGGDPQQFVVTDNIVSGALTALWIAPNPTALVEVRGLQVRKASVNPIKYGVLITSGAIISLSHIQLGDNAWTAGGGVLVNIQSAADIRSLHVDHLTSGETATPTYGTGLGDVVIYGSDGGGNLLELMLSHLTQVRLIMSLAVPTVQITDSTLTTAATGYLLNASVTGMMTNCEVTQVGVGTQVLRTGATATSLFTNVVWHGVTPTLNNGVAGSPHYARWLGGTFDQGSRITVNGELITDFRGVAWANFPDDGLGAITGNDTGGYSWILRIRDSDFRTTGTFSVPVVMTADPATSLLNEGNTFTGVGGDLVFGASVSAPIGDDMRGSGTPEGHVLGKVGDVYHRNNGGASTSIYIKESGNATNTGWIAK